MESGSNRPLNPRRKANFLSTLTFWWMVPIFKKGYREELKESDLFQTLESQHSNTRGDVLERAWLRENIKAKENNRDPSLTRVLVWTFGSSILGYGLRFAFIEMFIKMCQPIALGQIVLYYSNTEDKNSKLYIILYSSILVLSSILTTFIYHPTSLATFNKSLKLKVSLASLIYRKSLRISKSAVQNVTVGHMVNLLSSDLNNLDLICFFCHYLWIGPIVTVLSTIIMYYEIGPSAILGVVMILFTIVFQSWLIKFYATLKNKGATKTDARLELMNEIIKGIQVIKMYVWEKPFTKLITLIRKNEIKLIKYALYIKGLHVAFTVFRTRSAIFISILIFVLNGNILTAKNVFVITACFNVMRVTMTDYFTFAIEQAKVAKISIKRIEKFLLQVEVVQIAQYSDIEKKELIIQNTKNNPPKIILKNLYASWNQKHSKFALQNINLEIISSGYYAIIGQVGSGKSTVFNLILQELHPSEGTIITKGSISYSAQEPWLFSSTVRQNILFGNSYKVDRYKEIIKLCSLEEDFNSFPFGDETVIEDRGTNLSGGQKIRIHLARAIYKEADIYLLDDPFSGLDSNVSNSIFFNCINTYLKSKICILITHQHQYLKNAKEIFVFDKGEIKAKGNYNTIQSALGNFTNINDNLKLSDIMNNLNGLIVDLEVKNVMKNEQQVTEKQEKKGRVKWETYKAYSEVCGSICYALFVFFLFVLAQFFASAGDYFLKYWVNLEQSRHNYYNTSSILLDSSEYWQFCIYSYSGITIATIAVTLLSCFVFYKTSTRASRRLHDDMLEKIMQATMHFFQVNSGGRILNRFSKDVEVADVVMPYALINCMQIILSIFGVIVLVSLVNPWLIIPTVLVFFVLNFLRTLYLTVSSNIKRLENTTRSPLLSHLSTSAQGLSTIRAFKSQLRLEMEFDATQNVHTTARFLSIAASRMFAMWLEMVCAVYLALVIFSFLVFGNEYGGNVGLAITQVMNMMGSIQWGIRQSSELENHMVSIERIVEYRDLTDTEPRNKEYNQLPNWPKEGNIEFKDVCLTYETNKNPILKNITFAVKSKQKIGIIGRTGSGKTSIINALFQLSNTTGEILIDGINIQGINVQHLRSKLSIIPQEPMLFSGSLRKNLDPFDEYEDSKLLNVLKDINLYEKNILVDGLDTQIIENGSNFSAGEKQLVCLARAIIRNNRILILDEATANIDPETEKIIQDIVKTKFVDHTVLTIAHRLETIVDSDNILVMEDGIIKEFDHPHILLQNNESYLKKILQETGNSAESKFIKTTEKNYGIA